MSNRTRAYRRHHRARMIQRALRTRVTFNYSWNEEDCIEYAIKNHNHLAKCSCSACGNQRHNVWEKNQVRLTMQERKVYNALTEGLENYYDTL